MDLTPASDQSQRGGSHAPIAELLQQGLDVAASTLTATVSEHLRQEFSEFRDSLHAVSLDIQWTARRLRQSGGLAHDEGARPGPDVAVPSDHEMSESVDVKDDDFVTQPTTASRDRTEPLSEADESSDLPEVPNAANASEEIGIEDPGDHEDQPYCCESPHLLWSGDPENPGIECQTCGYVVAEYGQLVLQAPDGSPFDPDALRDFSAEIKILWQIFDEFRRDFGPLVREDPLMKGGALHRLGERSLSLATKGEDARPVASYIRDRMDALFEALETLKHQIARLGIRAAPETLRQGSLFSE